MEVFASVLGALALASVHALCWVQLLRDKQFPDTKIIVALLVVAAALLAV